MTTDETPLRDSPDLPADEVVNPRLVPDDRSAFDRTDDALDRELERALADFYR